jgi:alkylation response protein AidB-like acyl-CoA dehydrogenase
MELDEVIVPAENLLGKENQGFEIIMSSIASIPSRRLCL